MAAVVPSKLDVHHTDTSASTYCQIHQQASRPVNGSIEERTKTQQDASAVATKQSANAPSMPNQDPATTDQASQHQDGTLPLTRIS